MYPRLYTAPEDGNMCREDPTDIQGSTLVHHHNAEMSPRCGAGDIADHDARGLFEVDDSIYAVESTDCLYEASVTQSGRP